MRSTPVTWIALIAAALAPLPASAGHGGHVPAAAYHAAAYYRALLVRHRPAYWAGGAVFVPLAPFIAPQPIPVALRLASPRPRTPPITLRVPDEYLEAARLAQHPGLLWIKTARGFRLDDGSQP